MNNILKYIKYITAKYHLIWVLTYFILIGGSAIASVSLYHKYDQDQLPSGSIEFKISKIKYQLHEPIEFTVVNHFPTTIYVTNQCPGEPLNVFRWQNEQWVQIHDIARAESSSCSLQKRDVGILPEQTVSYHFNDWPNLFAEPGTYRIALSVNYSSELLFQDFNVLKPAETVEVTNKNQGTVTPNISPVIVPPVDTLIVEPVVETPVVEEQIPQEIYREGYEDEEDDD